MPAEWLFPFSDWARINGFCAACDRKLRSLPGSKALKGHAPITNLEGLAALTTTTTAGVVVVSNLVVGSNDTTSTSTSTS